MEKMIVAHVIVVIRATNTSPELVVGGKYQFDGADVQAIVMHILSEHGQAHDKLPDLHCYGCECLLTFDTPIKTIDLVKASTEGKGFLLLATTVCDKVECCRASVKDRFRAWVDGIASHSSTLDVRICDWCTRVELVTDSTPEMRRCSRCHLYYYCHRTCQAKAWPAHKLVCKPPVE